jgi:hypothetical protein
MEVKLGFGHVLCVPAVPETPETHETGDDGVHIHTSSPAQEAYCEVQFMIDCSNKDLSNPISNIFHWTVRLAGDKADVPYSQVEAEAARLVAPMLRDVADRVEKQVTEFDASRRKERGES